MSFAKLLEELVDSVYGARGAIFLDKDGEVVQRYLAHRTKLELDLIGAYHGITLSSCRRFSDEADLGAVDVMICQYQDLTCLIQTLSAGYFILLALSPQSNLGQAIYALRDLVPKLSEEMGV
jgi:predicted regulator of Ras-like GTPase activity (Roadblock/LC7/MglB family)